MQFEIKKFPTPKQNLRLWRLDACSGLQPVMCIRVSPCISIAWQLFHGNCSGHELKEKTSQIVYLCEKSCVRPVDLKEPCDLNFSHSAFDIINNSKPKPLRAKFIQPVTSESGNWWTPKWLDVSSWWSIIKYIWISINVPLNMVFHVLFC